MQTCRYTATILLIWTAAAVGATLRIVDVSAEAGAGDVVVLLRAEGVRGVAGGDLAIG